jgi:methylmalonyl-CoA mutase
MNSLFKEFAPINAQQWKDQIVKDLKGIDFDQLKWKAFSGLEIDPFYTSENLKDTPKPLFSNIGWDVCEHILVLDEKKNNEQALKALQGGASGLAFYIHKNCDLKTLLKDISLEHIYTQFFISNDALHILDDLKNVYGKKNKHDGKLKCFINIDPLCLAAYYGEWHNDAKKDLSVLKQLVHIPVNVSLYQEAGANTVNELAMGLLHLNEYFNYLNEEKELREKTLHFIFSVNANYFMEIAKLRAFRKLVALLQEQYKTEFPIHIHVQTAQQNKSSLDAYTNMLRSTTEAMSAIIGGCNSLSVLAYNQVFESPNDFSSRIARNQQHVLREESYLDKVSDPSAGSYFIESLTEELAEKSFEKFKELESKGGFISCLEKNILTEIIENDKQILIDEAKEGKLVLVGVNKYPNSMEKISSSQKKNSEERKTTFKAITPFRLAKSFEEEKANTVHHA